MTTMAVYVWSAGRITGAFPSTSKAIEHCCVITNDHRRKREIQQLVPGVVRYVGPRGRRHGSRLVAFICTPQGADLIGLDVAVLERKCGQVA